MLAAWTPFEFEAKIINAQELPREEFAKRGTLFSE